MKKFEYKIEYTDMLSNTYLNQEGLKGWELCCVIVQADGFTYYYWKRALPESNDKTETK